MPATATGRGAQVVLDPTSATAQAVRGAYASTMEANRAKVAADVLAGVVSDGTGQDGTTATSAAATDLATVPLNAAIPATFGAGISFGSQLASSNSDLSKHINLYGGGAGINFTTGNLININTGGGGYFAFNVGGAPAVYVSAGNINSQVTVIGPTLQTGGTSGPTWTSGSAAPASTQPVGSLYSRIGGAVGATLYVSRGAGTWAAVAGV
jgi:hypothetical protein